MSEIDRALAAVVNADDRHSAADWCEAALRLAARIAALRGVSAIGFSNIALAVYYDEAPGVARKVGRMQ